jgi:hypothetical protein
VLRRREHQRAGHSVRRVFPVTAERLAYQAGPSPRVNQLKPAPGFATICLTLNYQ